MPYRLYVDEVGNDDVTHSNEEQHRYLSLTGVAIKLAHVRDYLEPEFNSIKAEIFMHDPDERVIFHRKDILQKKKQFGILRDPQKLELFDNKIMHVIKTCDYRVITAFIDKRILLEKTHWKNQHPYHFLMEILVEKYTQFLERENETGDIMPEERKGKKDALLQKEFLRVRENGTDFVPASKIQKFITAHTLKFREKADNISGLQLSDLLAHPSHMHIRYINAHYVHLGNFCEAVRKELLRNKYDRSRAGIIDGYGIKCFL